MFDLKNLRNAILRANEALSAVESEVSKIQDDLNNLYGVACNLFREKETLKGRLKVASKSIRNLEEHFNNETDETMRDLSEQ